MFQTKVVEKIKTHIFCSVTYPPPQSCHLFDIVEKYCRAGQATDDNMAHVQCMLDTKAYKYTHSCCVILIALPPQQWLQKHTSLLHYTLSLLFLFQIADCCHIHPNYFYISADNTTPSNIIGSHWL